jgi:glyoxylase-like metal-dependent hydrolase (beta-lactamase superfamily II)
MTLNRRTLLQGTAAALSTAALATMGRPALAKIMPYTPSPAPGTQVPGIYRTHVGGITVTSVLDGGMELGLALFSPVPEDTLKARQQEAFQVPGPVKAYVNTFVVHTPEKVILVDSGYGTAGGETLGKLQQNLAAAGYKPQDITDIYLTHAHIDHVSGLTDAAGKPVFENAQLRLADTELQFWFDDEKRSKAPAGMQGLFKAARTALTPYKDAGRIATFKAGDVLSSGITSVDLAGHTPGHCGFRVSDGKEQLLIWGDIVHAPALQFAHPDWSIAFDTDKDQALAARTKILAEVAADRIRIAGMHLGFPALGNVAKAGSGYDFVPQVWEI